MIYKLYISSIDFQPWHLGVGLIQQEKIKSEVCWAWMLVTNLDLQLLDPLEKFMTWLGIGALLTFRSEVHTNFLKLGITLDFWCEHNGWSQTTYYMVILVIQNSIKSIFREYVRKLIEYKYHVILKKDNMFNYKA
jgi:hypothetical protein